MLGGEDSSVARTRTPEDEYQQHRLGDGRNFGNNFDVTGTDEGKTAMNEDVSIKLSATTEKGAVDQLLFEGFPTEVIMKQGETSKTVSVPVKDGLNKEHTVEISAFARGYKLENALQLLTVSDYHYSRVMIKTMRITQ